MSSTDTFFADIESVIAGFTPADRPRAQALIDELSAVAARLPRVAERCYAYQARLHARLGEFEQALVAVEKALLLMPLDDNLLILRGDIHRQAEEVTHALADYSRVIAGRPDSVTARLRRADLLQANHQYADALADLTEALRQEPRSHRLIYRRGLVLVDLGRAADAIPDFEVVARLSPDPDLRRKALERLRELGRAGC